MLTVLLFTHTVHTLYKEMSQWDEIHHLRCLTDLVRFSNHGQNKLAPRGRRETKKEIIWESTVSANFTQRPQS